VLVIRGDLLRRYPGTIVFAAPDDDGHADFASPEVKQPIFGGALGDEYRFLGFALDADRARDENWWFVFAEQPTEPRFGLDPPDVEGWGAPLAYVAPVLPDGTPQEILEAAAWNNASWKHAVHSDRFLPGCTRWPRPAGSSSAATTRPSGAPTPPTWRHLLPAARAASVSARDMLPEGPPDDVTADLFKRLRRQQSLPFRKLDA